MNIGIFTDCYLPTKNGVTTVIIQTKQELERRGHKVVALTVAYPANEPISSWNRGFSRSLTSATKPADPEGGLRAASIPDPSDRIYRCPSLPFRHDIEIRLGVARQVAINRIVEHEQLDIIHTHTEFSLGWAGKRAAQRTGLPHLHTLHTLYPQYRHYLPLGRLLPVGAINKLLARFLAGCAAAICPSEKGRAYVSAIRPDVNTIVIPNGVAAGRFDLTQVTQADRDRARAAVGVGPAERVILYVGRIAPEKRVWALFEALRPLLVARPDYRAVFVGSGPQRDALAAAARAAGLSGQIVLAGPVAWAQMPALYATAHVFATASLSEVHPMTLLEAATCGLPIVARRDTSLAGLVLDGFNGFLTDSDGEIAERLAMLLQNDPTRRTFAANAQTLAARFTVESHVDRLEAVYAAAAKAAARSQAASEAHFASI